MALSTTCHTTYNWSTVPRPFLNPHCASISCGTMMACSLFNSVRTFPGTLSTHTHARTHTHTQARTHTRTHTHTHTQAVTLLRLCAVHTESARGQDTIMPTQVRHHSTTTDCVTMTPSNEAFCYPFWTCMFSTAAPQGRQSWVQWVLVSWLAFSFLGHNLCVLQIAIYGMTKWMLCSA